MNTQTGPTLTLPREFGPSDQAVWHAPGLLFGRFRSAPGDATFDGCPALSCPHLSIPTRPVTIRPTSAPAFAAMPKTMVAYAPATGYERAVIDPDGDDSYYFALGPDADKSLLDAFDQLRKSAPITMRWSAVRDVFCLARAITEQGDPLHDYWTLAVEEMFTTACGAGAAARPPLTQQPASLRQARTIERVQRCIAAAPGENLSLGDLAQSVHYSPFHLSRLFKEQVGITIHQYRLRVRLARALRLIQDTDEDLASLAGDLGFSTHSHFTAAFRAAFAITPSAYRTTRELPMQ